MLMGNSLGACGLRARRILAGPRNIRGVIAVDEAHSLASQLR